MVRWGFPRRILQVSCKNNATCMKSLIFLFSFLFTYMNVISQSCTHTIQRTDTWGDGWNGGTVAVSVNGVTVLSGLSCSGYGPTSNTFMASAGATIRVFRTAAGAYPSEMRIRVLNGAGATIINTIQPLNGTATSGGHTVAGSCSGAAAGPCTNTSPYMTVTMPSSPGLFYASTCTFQSEYTTFTSVVSGRQYRSSYSLGGWITVRHTTPGGTVVSSGPSPLTWTAPVSGTYYVHYNTNSGCGTASSCGTDYIECLSCVAPTAPVNDLVCNSTQITCGQTISGTTVDATNSGTGEAGFCSVNQTQPGVWYVVPGNGQIMTANLCATAWDSKISVFSGPNCSTLSCVGGNDDWGPACSSSSASFSWTSTVGTNYYILVHGYSMNSSFSISLTCMNPPPPNPTSISATQNTICNGSSTTLTANGVSGTVCWYTGGCGFTQIGTGNSINVSPGSTTTYFARNLNSGLFSGGCAQITITVNPMPNVTITPVTNTICSGSTTQLVTQITGIGGNTPTYTWTPSTGLSNPAAPSPHASPTTTQAYQLTISYGGCSSTSQTTVTVNPSVGFVSQISGNSVIIAGTGETYSITPTANASYQWAYTESITAPLWINIPNSNSATITFTWPQTTTDGSARVIVSNANGCGTQTRFFNIITNGALPVELLSFDGQCYNESIKLNWETASEHNSDYFEILKSRDGQLWNSIDKITASGFSNQLISYSTIDSEKSDVYNYYKLLQVDKDGKSKEYGPINVICDENKKGYFSVFPNPTSGSFQVIVNDVNLMGNSKLIIKDTKGSEILTKELDIKYGINAIFVDDLKNSSGIYYIYLVNEKMTSIVIKIIIK